MKKMNKKGFSLVELLAVIVIVGALSIITITSVSSYINKSHNEKIEQNKKNVALAAQLYLQSNRDLFPKLIGDETRVSISDLRKNNYLKEDVQNDAGENCMKESFVRVYKLGEEDYSYTTYLYCGDEKAPAEVEVPKPDVQNFKFSDGTGSSTDGVFSNIKNAYFSFTMKGAKNDDSIGIYSYQYSIFVSNSSTDNAYEEVFNSGSIKGGLEPSITLVSKHLSSYIDITGYTKVRVDVTVINDKGGMKFYSTEDGGGAGGGGNGQFKDTEAPQCGRIEGTAQDDNDWINKKSFGNQTAVVSGTRTYPARITVDCSDGNGSGCKRDRFTTSWPNDHESASGIDYNLGTRWSYITIEDNAETTNTARCFVRVNVDVQAPEVVVTVYKATDKGKKGDAVLSTSSKTFTVKDSATINATMPSGTIASDQYINLYGTGSEKWMNGANYANGLIIEASVKDNLYLYSYEWDVNDPYIASGTSNTVVANSVSSVNGVAEQGSGTKNAGTFKSTVTDNPTSLADLATAEHGAREGTISGLRLYREGKRYGRLTVCDKANNCTTVHIYANIDVTPPEIPQTSYQKKTSGLSYTPATNSEYKNTTKWSNEYIRAYINGQREDKKTKEGEKGTISGWDSFSYVYRKQTGKSGTTYTWADGTAKKVTASSGATAYGFDIKDEGVHIVAFTSCDKAGNCSGSSNNDYIKVDTIKPTCELAKKYEQYNGSKWTDISTNDEIKKSGSTNGSGWLKSGQRVTLSHTCGDLGAKNTNGAFSSGCDTGSAYNKQTFLFDSDINTTKAGANGFGTKYGDTNDSTAGGHVVDYAGNMSAECGTTTVKIDYTPPACDTTISWPQHDPINPDTGGATETGWLGNVNNVKRTAIVGVACTDNPSGATSLMANVSSACDDAGTYDKDKNNKKTFTYNTEIKTTKAGNLGDNKLGIVIDNAGNTTQCTKTRTVNIDYTAPNCSTSIEYGVGNGKSNYSTSDSGKPVNGWLGFVGDTDTSRKMAKVSQVCSDVGTIKSGCLGTMGSFIYDTEINTSQAGAAGNQKGGYIEDRAGNTKNCPADQTVKIDYTRPVCSVTAQSTGTGNSMNWAHNPYNGEWVGPGAKVTVSSTCTTAESGTGNSSGCNSSDSYAYTAEMNTSAATSKGLNETVYVYDKAGNRSSAACGGKTVKIDKTSPTCNVYSRYGTSVSDSSSLYDGRWVNGSYMVRVTSQCSGDYLADGSVGSGCSETNLHNRDYTASNGTVLNGNRGSKTDGSGYVVSDNVGNTVTCGTELVRIDNQAPDCNLSATSGGSYYTGSWTKNDVRVSRTCSDGSGSGCDTASQSSQYRDYSGTYNGIYNITTGGAISEGNSGTVRDVVGNTTTCPANETIKIDHEPPTCTFTEEPSTTWARTTQRITSSCSDGYGSGCQSGNTSHSEVFNYNINNSSFPYSHTYYDVVGNSFDCTGYFPVYVDLDPPEGSCSVDGYYYDDWNGYMYVTVDSKYDALSGIDYYSDVYYYKSYDGYWNTNSSKYLYCDSYEKEYGAYIRLTDNAGNEAEIECDGSVTVPDCCSETYEVNDECNASCWVNNGVGSYSVIIYSSLTNNYVCDYDYYGGDDCSIPCEEDVYACRENVTHDVPDMWYNEFSWTFQHNIGSAYGGSNRSWIGYNSLMTVGEDYYIGGSASKRYIVDYSCGTVYGDPDRHDSGLNGCWGWIYTDCYQYYRNSYDCYTECPG